MIASTIAGSTRRNPLGWATVAAFAALAYFVVIGGSTSGELNPVLRSLNALIAGSLLVRYVWRMPRAGDRIDGGLLAAVVLFGVAGTLSHAPRQSFDAVLMAATYAAALFTARDLLAREAVRATFIRLLMALSLLFTLVTAYGWFSLFIGWWSATQWSVIPPLDLAFAGQPWGYRYDLAFLLVALYPVWWIGAISPLRRVIAVVVGIVVALIVLIVGSRTLWAALAIAIGLVIAPTVARAWPRSPRVRAILLAGVAIGLALLIVSGVAAAFIHRASSSTALGWRTAMWGPLLEVWASHPIAGYGPGSFPWLLQLTTYFDTHTWAPRHPDSVPFQLVGEAGFLGLLSAVVVVATLLPPILRGRSAASRFVLFAFIVESFGGNPTEFPFLMAIVIAWVAYAVPHEASATEPTGASSRRVRAMSLAALVVVALAYFATLSASFFYENARAAVADGNLAGGRRALDVAVSLDPSMALYWRQRGELGYLEKEPDGAISDLREATRLNPSDDLAWRVLALASAALGDDVGAQSALTKALAVQRSDVTNLLLEARWLGQHNRITEAREILGEVVQSWPAIVAAPGWDDMLPPSVTTPQIVDVATRRWELGLSTPALPSDQGLWLATLDNRPDLDGLGIGQATLSRPLAEAELVLLRCGSADSLLRGATDEDKRTVSYWITRLRSSALAGQSDEAAMQALRIMSGDLTFPGDPKSTLNPLDENGLSSDVWGYRRLPIQWPDGGLRLASPRSGSSIWLLNPLTAVRDAGLERALPDCRRTGSLAPQ
jgi:O-antigen ligase